MVPISTTAIPPLVFDKVKTNNSVRAQAPKIGWLHSKSKPGSKFDLTIKDVFGRVKMQKLDCGNESGEYGELVNFPTMLGEELSVEVNNIRGAEEVSVFLN